MNKKISAAKIERTMTSKEIADITGKRHDHVMRDINVLNKSYAKISLPKVGEREYKDSRGKQRKVYVLTKLQSLDLMSGYDTNMRIKIIRRWDELEKKDSGLLPDFSNPAEAARAWADQYEGRKAAEIENAEMKPKAEFYDRVTDSRDAIQIGDAAKVLNMGVGRNQLFEFLRGIKVLMADNMPYQKYINRGYFRVIEQEYEKPSGETGVSTKTLVYQKGLDFIRKKLQEVKKC